MKWKCKICEEKIEGHHNLKNHVVQKHQKKEGEDHMLYYVALAAASGLGLHESEHYSSPRHDDDSSSFGGSSDSGGGFGGGGDFGGGGAGGDF